MNARHAPRKPRNNRYNAVSSRHALKRLMQAPAAMRV